MDRMRVDESSWYYSWVVNKGRARDGIKDLIVRTHDTLSVVDLTVQVASGKFI